MSHTDFSPLVRRPEASHEQKEHLRHGRRIQDRIIIVVAPPEVTHRIERTVDVDVIAFAFRPGITAAKLSALKNPA